MVQTSTERQQYPAGRGRSALCRTRCFQFRCSSCGTKDACYLSQEHGYIKCGVLPEKAKADKWSAFFDTHSNGTEVPEDLKFLAELGRLGWSAAAKAIAAAEKNTKEKKKEVSAAEDEQAKQEQQQMQRLQQMGIDKVNTPAAAGTSPKRKSQKNKKRAGAAQSPKSPGSGKRTSNSPAGQRDGKKQKHR
ncbi:hypothetical protein OEZ85_013451 [Tetradesmus obliquus]|uniref:PARP-type domain-containing protein n=1 Tax=Tetradesmus obliquus TaxID=3088 RepID=A0ABY8URN3_TETOB|nr:hypothetical protein OEZ85_013451 [Tetradesmus obliquus]